MDGLGNSQIKLIGTYDFSNGERYVGEFRNDKFDGKGTPYI